MRNNANAVKTPHSVHFLACLERYNACSYSPLEYKVSIFVALIIPTMPNGKQQKQVTNIDSTNHVLGIDWESGGTGGKLDNKSDNSGTVLAGFQLENPTLHTIVSVSIFLLLNSSKEYGPCFLLFCKI